MHDEQGERDASLFRLRGRLADGLAHARLSKTQLAKQAGLGRTTVQQAFQADAPTPSAETVAALARVLRLPETELMDLRRLACGESAPAAGSDGLGKPIKEWSPHDLEVHPAGLAIDGQGQGAALEPALPTYVPRAHDLVLAEIVRDAVQGRSRIVALVGTSSTGKTRACWEAVQSLADREWKLWHPFDPTRAEAALEDLSRVQRRTVVWLNEAQHYLGHSRVGEQVAAAVQSLLNDPGRQPVLVLGTLWPEYVDQYTALPSPGAEDLHSRVRELLSGRTLTIPETFDEEALRQALALGQQGDVALADALNRAAADGRVTQDLAGAPELLRRYEHSTPAARAVLEAAMDARRLGAGIHLPQAFLTDAAIDYLSVHDFDQITDDWAEAAFAELARPVHGKHAPLRRARSRPQRRPPGTPLDTTTPGQDDGPMYRLADYLEQHGRSIRRSLCPPGSFWHAAHSHLTHRDDLVNLAEAAETRCRLQWTYHLRHRAAEGRAVALVDLARRREADGDRKRAEALYQEAADTGDPSVLVKLAGRRKAAGDHEQAEALYQQAVYAGSAAAMVELAGWREASGDHERAEALYHQAVDAGSATAMVELARRREASGDHEQAEVLARQAADAGNAAVVAELAQIREKTRKYERAEALAQHAADAGNSIPLAVLARKRERAGKYERAAELARLCAEAGDSSVLVELAGWREASGDHERAEALYHQAVDAGSATAMV
ncbi:helix-turn-helix domain-containing protein, partial [Streptomyces europaeiscabiei]|uniref:helix-turn-helix domain-containing protein n=1 Tax=Streptomyces europaeiscabiei TaxID=146819 RepID=UPI0029AD60BF